MSYCCEHCIFDGTLISCAVTPMILFPDWSFLNFVRVVVACVVSTKYKTIAEKGKTWEESP